MDELGVRALAQSVSRILAPGRTYRIPSYQRSYSWQERDAGALLQDLLDGCQRDREHFLGAIVTVEPDENGLMEVIDGQQRLTTLSILIAILRDRAKNASRSDALDGLLNDTNGQARLRLNHVDDRYFSLAVRRKYSTLSPDEIPIESDSHGLIRDNMIAMAEIVEAIGEKRSEELETFLQSGCPIIHAEVSNRDMGYRVFQVLNTRGRQPNAHDILKTELFERAELTSDEAEHLARRWTEYEARLGAKSFDDLLRQIRALYDKTMRGDLVVGFCTSVLPVIPPRDLLVDVLPRYVDAYAELSAGQIMLSRPMPEVKHHIDRLQSLEHTGWRAPALKFLVTHDRDADTAREFFCDLERLAFAMQLIETDRDIRMRRYRRVADEMTSDTDLFAGSGALSLSQDEREKLTQRLTGRFGSVSQRRALAFKLNALLKGGEFLTPSADATVEHILPRHPAPGSRWLQDWPDLAVRRELCDCLGNFCLLTQADNRKADRLDYAEKRSSVFLKREAEGSYALTREAATWQSWTPETVQARNAKLVDLLVRDWKLDLPGG